MKNIKAIKLFNTLNNTSDFVEGTVTSMEHISATHFFFQAHVEDYELKAHPAPRYQFVITLKGKLKFTVTNGRTFIIEPGVILIANDLLGEGHTWELLGDEKWQRVYIVLPSNAPDHFIADK